MQTKLLTREQVIEKLSTNYHKAHLEQSEEFLHEAIRETGWFEVTEEGYLQIVSDLKVLKSAAGYYIGRDYYDTDLGLVLPWSRESVHYYPDQEEAQSALDNNTYTKRMWA